MEKRLNWIDWAKTLGIFLVVLGHIYYPADLQYFKYLIYGFHMPFFFFVSGILSKPEEGYLKKNMQRLVVPYLAFNVFVLVIFNLPNCLFGELPPIKLLVDVKNIIFGLPYPPSGPSWFLLALFWAKVSNQFLLKLKPIFSVVLSIFIAVLGYVLYHHVSHKIPFFLCQGMLATPIITAGYYIKKYDVVDFIFNKRWLVLLSCFILIPVYLLLASKLNIIGFIECDLTNIPILGVVMVVSGCYIFTMLCRTFNHLSNQFVLRISSGTIVVLALNYNLYWAFFRIYPSGPTIPISLFVCFLIMIVCYIIISLLEKNNILSTVFLGKPYKKKLS